MEFSTKFFTYDKRSKMFITEISTLGNELHSTISLISQWTNKKMQFKLVNTKYNNEGDLMFWEFTSPQGFRIKIFND